MTLLDEDAPDAEDFVVCWLQPILRAATERDPGDALPFAVVQRVAGSDDQNCGEDEAVVQIDVFAATTNASLAEGLAPNVAKYWAKRVTRRMNRLSRNLDDDVTMSDGSVANADYVANVMKPVRMPYQDESIVRVVGRWSIGRSYVAVP